MKHYKLPPAAFSRCRRLRRPRSEEGERIRLLLKRLQCIVPEAPKNRRLPQVEVIQHVIDYICQLEDQVADHLAGGKQSQVHLVADRLASSADRGNLDADMLNHDAIRDRLLLSSGESATEDYTDDEISLDSPPCLLSDHPTTTATSSQRCGWNASCPPTLTLPDH